MMQEKTRHENRCYKCVWRHAGGDYLCDFATLAAPPLYFALSPALDRMGISAKLK